MGISALAGPVANLIAAIVGGLILNALYCFCPEFLYFNKIGEYIILFLSFYITINVTLAVFNLVPIPPLDGSKIMFMFLPDKLVAGFYKYEKFFFIAIIVLLWTGVLPVSLVSNYVKGFIVWLTGLPFGV